MKRFFLATTALMSLGFSPQIAFAQDAEASAADDDVIVVTARKREENLIDVPVPVSVATGAQLKRDQIYTATDLQRITPALEMSQTSGGEVNGGARLRGLGTGVFNSSVSPSVAFQVDQVPQGNLTFPILFDLAQVEVLRGPQGTLFGQGASAGVINITTVAPDLNDVQVSGGIDYADKGTLGSEVGETIVRAAFNAPIVTDVAALRIAMHFKRELGLQRNTYLKRDNDIREYGLRAKLLVEPSDAVKINLSGEIARQRQHGWNFFAVASNPTSTDPFDPDGPGPIPVIGLVGALSTGDFLNPAGCNMGVISARAEFYCEDSQAQLANKAASLSGRIDVDLSDSLTLTSVTSYRTLNRETETVNFSRRIINNAARNENQESDAKQLSQEVRLGYDTDNLNLVLGSLYSNYTTETTPIINRPLGETFSSLGQRTGFSVCANLGSGGTNCPFIPFINVDLRPKLSYELTKNHILAFFGDATFSLGDKIDLFGGLRYSSYKNTTGVGINTVVATRTSETSEDNVSGRVGLSFKPAEGTTLYGSYSRGYKPSAIVVPTIATNAVTVLKPELADAIELGAKKQVGSLQLSGNLFWTRVKNFQTQNSEFQGIALVSVVKNISKVESKGFELGAFGRLGDHLSINAGYQYNDVKFPAGFLADDSTATVPVNIGGTQFLNAPKHKFTISGDASLPMGTSTELFLNANMVYKSSVLLAQRGDPRYRFPAHEIINGAIGIRDADDKWKASLFVRNLTKQREPTAYLAGDFAGNTDGSLRAWPVAGLTARVVGMGLDFSF